MDHAGPLDCLNLLLYSSVPLVCLDVKLHWIVLQLGKLAVQVLGRLAGLSLDRATAIRCVPRQDAQGHVLVGDRHFNST